MRTLQAAILALVILTGAAPASAQDPSTRQPADLAHVSLDELISRLPRTGCEGHRDDGLGRFVFHPVVGELRERLARGDRMSDVQWEAALLSSQAIHIRPKWPVDLPLAVFMQVPAWLGQSEIRAMALVGARPALHAGSTRSNSCGTTRLRAFEKERWQEIGTLSLGTHRIHLDVVVEIGETFEESMYRETGEDRRKPTAPILPRGIVWQGRVELGVEIVPSVDSVVPPRQSSMLDEKLRGTAHLEFWHPPGSREWKVGLAFMSDAVGFQELFDTAFSLEVELWRG